MATAAGPQGHVDIDTGNQAGNTSLGEAVTGVTERVQILVREEIELAKAEMTEKVTKLVKGAVVGGVAGVFALVALLYLLNAAAWGVADLFSDPADESAWLGYLIVAVLLLVLGAIAGFVAAKLFKGGTPPTPTMAIDEAQRIRQTVKDAR